MTKLSMTTSGHILRKGFVNRHSKILIGLNMSFDVALLVLAFCFAYIVRTSFLFANAYGFSHSPNYYLALLLFVICYILGFNISEIYTTFRDQQFRQIFLKILKGAFIGTLAGIFCIYIIKEKNISRILIGLFFVFAVVLVTLAKAILYKIESYYRSKDYNLRKVLVVGSKERAIELIASICEKPSSGYRVAGCLELAGMGDMVGKTVFGDVKVVGTLDNFKSILLDTAIDEIVFAVSFDCIADIHDHIRTAEKLGINIRIMPDFQIQKIMYHPETANMYLEQFAGCPTISLSSDPLHNTELSIKTILDHIGSGIALIILSPLLLTIATAVKLTSKGAVLFKQERVGLNGRKFTLYKFRTMVENAEELKNDLAGENEMSGPVFKMTHDPRITAVGRFLRKTSLDELPQLFNIFKGEMSLVGPRPPLASEVEQYKLWQRRRLSMRPGLTCIWQVSGRNNISFEKWMELDLQYIDNWSIWLDFKLLLLTCREVIYGGGH